MLSSAPSSLLLSSALVPVDAAAGANGLPGPAAPGFAELLKGLPTQAGTPPSSVTISVQADPGALAGDVVPAPMPAVVSAALAGHAGDLRPAANLVQAATAGGKILPVALPPAEGSAAEDTPASFGAGSAAPADPSLNTPGAKSAPTVPSPLAANGNTVPAEPATTAPAAALPSAAENLPGVSAEATQSQPVPGLDTVLDLVVPQELADEPSAADQPLAAVAAPAQPVVAPETVLDAKPAAVTTSEVTPESGTPLAKGNSATGGDPLLAVPGLAPAPSPASAAAETSSTAGPAPSQPALPLPAHVLAAATASHAHLPSRASRPAAATETPSAEPRTAAGVQISVATRPEAAPLSAAAPAEPVASTAPKPLRPAEPLRAELPGAAQPASAPLASGHSEPAAPAQALQAPNAPAPGPTPADINAALDRLIAAREALMPAETAMSIDHAEFGKVTIRIEQSSDGRISAELGGADPDLQRAVTAAATAERGASAGSESDGGRPGANANARGSLGGGEAAPGERGQRGNDRETNSRHTAGRPEAESGAANPHSGVFA